MAPPTIKKRRLDKGSSAATGSAEPRSDPVFSKLPLDPATDEEKRVWQGFCEIESDPAFFNVMLTEFGVQGVKVQEVFGLDEELLLMLPKPVYGLIFLFRYREVDTEKQEVTCPEHIWFANQTTGNACATVALLNIVLNVPNLELGDQLQNFRDFTKDFPPAMRGDQLTNFEFIKAIHNSFARKIDMLNIDLKMKQDFTTRRTKTASSGSDDSDESEAAFHFIAYLPIGDEIWKLDGLDRQPQRLGKFRSGDWLPVVAPMISSRMAQYEDGEIEFGLLSLVKDPILGYRSQLAKNIRSLQEVESRLEDSHPNWRETAINHHNERSPAHQNLLREPCSSYGITEELLLGVELPVELENTDLSLTELMDVRQTVIAEQEPLRVAVKEEEEAKNADADKAARRRYDYGPAIRTWLRMLAENDVLKTLIETTEASR